jgi:hypothetical protein
MTAATAQPMPLGLALRLFAREPVAARPACALTHQLWRGGATDLRTRAVIEHPPRWLLLADHEAAQPFPRDAGALLAWDLEQVLPGRRLSPANAGGVILVSMDVDPDRDQEFNDWYNTEHIPRLSAIPGVVAARRFRVSQPGGNGAPAYVALYHVTCTGIYASQTWVSANHTPWMLRMRRFQRNRTYFMFPTSLR